MIDLETMELLAHYNFQKLFPEVQLFFFFFFPVFKKNATQYLNSSVYLRILRSW